jgi:tetratricopeptide (TPR) repeat protein
MLFGQSLCAPVVERGERLMQHMALKIAVFLFLLLPVLLTMDRTETVAHDRDVHRNSSDTPAFPSILPERARLLLASIVPLSMAQQDTNAVNVTSSVLCFCLSKAGESIQELRRLQTEWFDKGRIFFTAQNYPEAITAFTRAINLNMRDASVYTNRGLAHADRGDYQQALRDFSRAIALNHHQAEAYYARGLVAFIIEDVPAARLDLQTAADLNYAPAERLMRLAQPQSTP